MVGYLPNSFDCFMFARDLPIAKHPARHGRPRMLHFELAGGVRRHGSASFPNRPD